MVDELNRPATPQEKLSLRRHLLAQRQAIAPAQWRQKSDRLCRQLQQAGLWQPGDVVLAYFSTRQEPDLSPLFTSNTKVSWGFPRCVGKQLYWHRWSPHSLLPLQTNRYGIAEPHPDAPCLSAAAVKLMLVPAVACDRNGYRLGYGGGFYDRLLSQPDWAALPTVGIVFSEALLPQVPKSPWDLPLKTVCTDQGLYRVGAADI